MDETEIVDDADKEIIGVSVLNAVLDAEVDDSGEEDIVTQCEAEDVKETLKDD